MEIQCLLNGQRPRKAQRVISKSGERNISFSNLPQRSKRYIKDFVTTIIDTRWRTVVSAYLIATFGCWTIFAVLWYLIAYAHNDLSIDSETGVVFHEGTMTCVEGTTTMTAFFLLSFEIQTTVGFGERYPKEECPEAVFMFIAQIIVGVAIDGLMIGIIYAKLSRPPRKPYHLKFSRKAVVCMRDSKLCFIFRICDPKENHVIDSTVRACLIGEHSENGVMLKPIQHPMKLEDNGRVLVLFPLTICHVIDINTPLYTLSAKDFLTKRFEIIITFTGASASTGHVTEERTSYLSSEIEWGHRFVNIVNYDADNGTYFVDYNQFDGTEEVERAETYTTINKSMKMFAKDICSITSFKYYRITESNE